jgi:hypothetical protein
VNQAVSFGLLGVGGILLTKALTGSSFANTVKGHPGKIPTTGSTLTVAGAGTAVANAATSSAPAAGTQSMAQVRDYLQSRGLSKVAASGVVGNIWQESSGDPNAPGGGLVQWIGSRWTALVAFAQLQGLSPNSESAQLQYLVHELFTQYPGLVNQINSASSPAEAATLVSQQYERPSTPMLSNRINYANQAFAS